jgi:hypothetical protein
MAWLRLPVWISGFGCVVVRVMKGPAYVADAYALPNRTDSPGETASNTN